jgi:hypothetical protein
MDIKHAKFILESFRHGGQDAADPQFAEALAQVARDSELACWFAGERALDEAIGRKLKETPVPSDLRDAIVAGHVPVARGRMPRRQALLALAACLAVLATAAVLGSRWATGLAAGSTFAAYQRTMLDTVSMGVNFDLKNNDPVAVEKWLVENRVLSNAALPASLRKTSTRGCRALRWRKRLVALICFGAEGNQTVHLFVVSRRVFSQVPAAQVHFGHEGIWTTASWTNGENVYLMASTGDEALLRKYL